MNYEPPTDILKLLDWMVGYLENGATDSVGKTKAANDLEKLCPVYWQIHSLRDILYIRCMWPYDDNFVRINVVASLLDKHNDPVDKSVSCFFRGIGFLHVYDLDSAFELRSSALRDFNHRKDEVFDTFIKRAGELELSEIEKFLRLAKDYEEVPPIGPDPEVIMSFPASPSIP